MLHEPVTPESVFREEDTFRVLIEGLRDYAIIILDPEGRVRSWTPGAERLYGYRADEIIGRNCACFYLAEDAGLGKPERDLAMAAAEGCFEEEGWRQSGNGARFWAHTSVTALSDTRHRPLGFACITRDMTEQRHLARNEHAARQAILAETVPGILSTWTPDGESDYVNRHFLMFTGTPPFASARQAWHDAVHPDDRERVCALWTEAVSQGRAFTLEYRLRRHDGVYCWFRGEVVPVLDTQGRIVKWSGLAVDIEVYKRQQETLHEADRRKDEFLAILAHELRNPLAPISTAVQILRCKGPHAPDLEAPIGMIDRQVQHLARLVDDLLDISRLTRGKIKLCKQPTDLAAVVSQVVENHLASAAKHRHDLSLDIPPRPVHVEGDHVRLTQMIGNLLNNAIKYTPDGGRIRVVVQDLNGEARVSVRDNGIGIAPETLQHIFEPFTQGHQGIDRAQGGLGIGLALVHRLAELHRGRVSAESAGHGQGSEFSLHFPLLPRDTEPVPRRHSASAAPASVRLRVLVVDDNRDAAESTALLIELWGHETRTVHDGATALDACREYRPDVLLLDIGLPGMDGYEIARRLRQDCGEVPVLIAITGYGQADDRERAMAAGFDHYLVKPIDAEALRWLLRELHSGFAR